ncbi:MAG: TetR/AcrR family transcriptional regulator [Nitrospinae bacterium]|nr:TetR/AcrR family transcriptional regulator [Nitrospinota bacterium]
MKGKKAGKGKAQESLCRGELGESARRIVEVAEGLFAEHGFDGVSMSDIAKAANVSKANLYHHFESKRNLYIAVVSACKNEIAPILHDMLNMPASFRDGFGKLAAGHLDGLLKRERVTRLVRREMLEDGERFGQELAQKVHGEQFANFVKVLRHAQDSGELRDDVDPAMVALLVVAANLFFFDSKNVFRHFPDVDFADDPRKYSTKGVDILLNGILAGKKKTKNKKNKRS